MMRHARMMAGLFPVLAAGTGAHFMQPAAIAAQPAAAAHATNITAAAAAVTPINASASSSSLSARSSSSSSPSAAAAPVAAVAVVSQQAASGKKKSDQGGFKHMIAGSAAGMASKTILQPLDLVKVRLQVQDGTGKNEYKGLYDGVKSILRNDGFLGLYRGLAPNLMASGVSWGVYFFSYNHAKNFWRQHLLTPLPVDPNAPPSAKPVVQRLGPFAHLSCAAFSGTLATLFTNPFSMVKTRLQLQGKEVNSDARLYRGVFDAFQRIVREEGFFTLYRGIGPSLVLVSNGALQFMSYEELKRLTITHLIASHEEKELHAAHFLCMGALAKVFSATVTYPMAVTRARLYQRRPDELLKAIASEPIVPSVTAGANTLTATMAAGPLAAPSNKHVDGKYHGMIDVISKIWALEGWRGFYRGLTPMLIKTAPSSAITFMIYESTIKLLHADPAPKKSKLE